MADSDRKDVAELLKRVNELIATSERLIKQSEELQNKFDKQTRKPLRKRNRP